MLIDRKPNHRPAKPRLQNLLRLGLYQIFWLERIPNTPGERDCRLVSISASQHKRLCKCPARGYLREFEPHGCLLAI